MNEKEELRFIENVPASQLLEKIKYNQESVTYEHTNLQNAVRDKRDLAELMTCNASYTDPAKPKYPPVQSLITYPIGRMIYFNTIATIETELKIQEEADLYEYVDKINPIINDTSYTNIEQDIRLASAEQTKQILDNIERGIVLPEQLKYRSIYEQIRKNLAEGHYLLSQKFMDSHHIAGNDKALHLLAQMTIEDIIYNDQIKRYINTTIDPKINKIIDDLIVNKVPFNCHDEKGLIIGQGPLERLSLHQGEERQTFMLAGAPASGKGAVLAEILLEAKETKNIDAEDIVKINTDTHRFLVCKGSIDKMGANKELHVSLNNDEASYITSMAYQKIQVKIESGSAPHLLVDGVAPNDDRIQLGTKNDGHLSMSVITTHPEQTVERAQNRGDKYGRYVQTTYLINSHKVVTNEVYKMLCDPKLIGKKPITVSIYDNNVAPGESPIHIAEIDMQRKMARILDNQKLGEFRGKRTMDPVENRSQFFREALRTRRGSFSSSELFQNSGYTVTDESIKPEENTARP